MPNLARQRGDYFERRTRETLEAEGFVVIRSAGSLGCADLVALKAGELPLLISCKLHGKLPRSELNHLEQVARRAGALPILAWRVRRGWVGMTAVSRHGNVAWPDLHMPPARPARTRPTSDGLAPAGVQMELPLGALDEAFE